MRSIDSNTALLKYKDHHLMKFKYISVLIIFIFSTISCRHDHPPASKELIQAFEIQKEGLKEIISLEKKMSSQPQAASTELKQRLTVLKNAMIEIEGMAHDHSQCSGDHSKKRFTIPDDEMIKVQSEWKDSIMSFKRSFNKMD